MKTTIQALMQRLNVRVGGEAQAQAETQVQNDFFGAGLDLEAIIRCVIS
jgi:hypothetical protein